MQFRETTNKQTGKRTYFVDGKKVSKNTYEMKKEICIMNNFKYNSSLVQGNSKYTHYYFHMN